MGKRRERRSISGGEVTERGTMGRTFFEGLSRGCSLQLHI
jgi:hypothetical protein